jgi:FkbM family methyltransferase
MRLVRSLRRIAQSQTRLRPPVANAKPVEPVDPVLEAERARKRAARAERVTRQSFFEAAASHTPYLAVEADEMTFLVATWDQLGRGLFTERRRAEMETLANALSLIERLGPAGMRCDQTFIDVGANIGTTTVTALRRHGFGSGLAIEPEPRNLLVLRLNVVVNDLSERVRTVGCAIADSDGEAPLVVYGGSSGKHRVGSARAGQATVLVAQRTLDGVIAAEGLDPASVGLVWIDTQGHEGHVLAGARELLLRGAPLVAEVAPKNLRMSGGLPRMAAALCEHYTHFIDLRTPLTRAGDPELMPAGDLERIVEDYETRPTGRFTDILAVRLPA